MESYIVIKIKHENILRRFKACIVNDELDFNMDGLREKMISLFKFAPDTQLQFTYNDEDNDVVALVDDEDLRDMARQALNPLRITVDSSAVKSLNSLVHSSGSSTPSMSTPLWEKLHNMYSGVPQVLESLPKPMGERSSRLQSDFAEIISTYGPYHFSKANDCFSKDGYNLSELPYTGESKESVEACKDSDNLRNLLVPTEVTSRASVEKATSKIKKVMRKSLSFKSDRLNLQGVSQAPPGLKDSLATSVSGSTNTSQPTHPILPNAHVALKDKQEVKETGEVSGVKYFGAPPVANNNSSSGNETTSVEGGREKKSVSGLQCSSTPLVSCTSLKEGTFTGMRIINGSVTPHDTPSEMPERIYSCSYGIFHRAIRCDGCSVHPITGPRFKSKVKEDYDLCSNCFAKMGNDADFVKIDHPVVNRLSSSFKDSFSPVRTPQELDCSANVVVSILDGTIITPSTRFLRSWRMKNNGKTVWPQGTRLVWVGGVRMRTSPSIELKINAPGVQVGQELDVVVDFVSPEQDGRHISYWRMALPSGQKFGQHVWVLIEVKASVKKLFNTPRPGFNLNLPPASEGVTAPGVDIPSPEPTVDKILPETNMSNASAITVDDPNISKASVETIQPVVNGKASKEHEAKFPIDDTLLAGIEASSDEANTDVKTEEACLLNELEGMGFNDASLNKEILKMNKYDVEQTIVDLCGDYEWDTILEELEDMGFNDEDTNKQMLKENDASTKSVVEDLIAGE